MLPFVVKEFGSFSLGSTARQSGECLSGSFLGSTHVGASNNGRYSKNNQ
jgi:hypothetical protein